jgi:phosphatidylserine/phosphatidylglycerophosphate/cardiolipin synthase-like enzyme
MSYKYNNKNKSHYRSLLDENFDFQKAYFFQSVSDSDWNKIEAIVREYFEEGSANEKILDQLDPFQNLDKGETNVKKLREIVEKYEDKHSESKNILILSRVINKYILKEYYSYNSTVFECHFFPNESNEVKVANMLRTCSKTLDIAIFSLSNDVLYEAVKEVWNAGCSVRIIADDECCKNYGSDIYRLAAIGIPVKTDNSEKFHMHHKFAVIDQAVVVTGSFNWTSQAVKNNQENILFIENKGLAKQYIDEYNNLWNTFTIEINQEKAKKLMEESRKR